MKILSLFFLLAIVSLYSCNTPSSSYKERMAECRANPQISTIGKDTIRKYSHECIFGAKLPKFVAKSINGEVIDQEYLNGKVNFINFWFETCPPCVAEMPGFTKLVEKFDSKDVNFLAFGTDTEKDIREFLSKNDFNFLHVANSRSIYRDTFSANWGFPTTLITDKKGIIRYNISGLKIEKSETDSLGADFVFNKFAPLIEELL